MTNDDIKAAEARAYQRGYAAGRRRKAVDVRRDRDNAERAAFRRRAFLAALPAFITAQNWTMDGKEVTNLDQRVELAWRAADHALRRYY